MIIRKFFQNSIILFSALLVIWSLYWFFSRPYRKSSNLGGKTEITFYHFGSRKTDKKFQSIVNKFEEKNKDITVKRINIPLNYIQKLQILFASGDPADVMYLGHDQVQIFAEKKLLYNLIPLIKEDNNFNTDQTFEAVMETVLRHDDDGSMGLYGLPVDFTTVGFFYNKDLFDRAGVAYPSSDWDWDEFEQKAQKIAELEGVYGVQFNRWSNNIQAIMHTFSTEMFVDNKTGLNHEDSTFVSVLERIRSWKLDYKDMLPSFTNPLTAEGAFKAGTIGMYGPAGRWVVLNFEDIKTFDWDYVRLPRGTTNANNIWTGGVAIAKDGKHIRESWKFAKFMQTREAQVMISVSDGNIPVNKSVALNEFLDREKPPKSGREFLEPLNYARPMNMPTDSRFISDVADVFTDALYYGHQGVREALAELDANTKKRLRSPFYNPHSIKMPWLYILIVVLLVFITLVSLILYKWYNTRPKTYLFREEVWGIIITSPWILGLIIFTAFPIVLAFFLMFTDWNGMKLLSDANWVGFDNIKHMLFYDEKIVTSLWATFYFVLLIIPLGQGFALAVAMLMKDKIWGINFFRSAWYLPSVITGVGMAILWTWVFDDKSGFLNAILRPIFHLFNSSPPEWFGQDAKIFAIPAFVIMQLWSVGGGMLIYLAGLNAIPEDLYHAAKLDGAGPFKRFYYVTVPMLSPIILFQGIMAIIGAFTYFTNAYVMTGGGEGGSSLFYSLYLYYQAFQFHEMGYAATMAWLLFLIILILTFITMRLSKNRIHYEGLRS